MVLAFLEEWKLSNDAVLGVGTGVYGNAEHFNTSKNATPTTEAG